MHIPVWGCGRPDWSEFELAPNPEKKQAACNDREEAAYCAQNNCPKRGGTHLTGTMQFENGMTLGNINSPLAEPAGRGSTCPIIVPVVAVEPEEREVESEEDETILPRAAHEATRRPGPVLDTAQAVAERCVATERERLVILQQLIHANSPSIGEWGVGNVLIR